MTMHLANAIFYITDGEKTQEGVLVGSHNCGVDIALQEMQEVRPETAMEITQKFVERYFQDDFL